MCHCFGVFILEQCFILTDVGKLFLVCGWKNKAQRHQGCLCLCLQADLVLLQHAPNSYKLALCCKQHSHNWHDAVPEFRLSSTASRSELVSCHSKAWMSVCKILYGCTPHDLSWESVRGWNLKPSCPVFPPHCPSIRKHKKWELEALSHVFGRDRGLLSNIWGTAPRILYGCPVLAVEIFPPCNTQDESVFQKCRIACAF